MVTQKAISLKIDYELLEGLDSECATGWRKRNSHINEAVRFYLELLDTRRRVRSYGSIEDQRAERDRFLRRWFPECLE